MRLVACPTCHAQFDVSDVATSHFDCRCGEKLDARPHAPVDAAIRRCGSCGASVQDDAAACDYCGGTIERDLRKLSLLCPECFARNAEAARFCTACGVGFRPEPIPDSRPELPCPACGALMPPRSVGGVPVNECPGCNGLWVPGEAFDALVSRALDAHQSADPAKLEKLKPRVRGANPAQQKVQYRKCPCCSAFMQRRNFRKSSGVIIDRCGNDGTFLDADELEQIAGFVLSGVAPALQRHAARDRSPGASPAKSKREAIAGRRVSQDLDGAPNVGRDRRRERCSKRSATSSWELLFPS